MIIGLSFLIPVWDFTSELKRGSIDKRVVFTFLCRNNLKIQVPKINVQHQIHYNQNLKRLHKNSQEQLIQTTTKFGQKPHSKI